MAFPSSVLKRGEQETNMMQAASRGDMFFQNVG
jgi:hypothetical protein